MIALLKKELHYFFSTAIGFIFLASFYIFTGLFLWVLEGSFNIPDSGFASLASFFELTPWLFTFLIPAISMHTFAEESKQGTLELLLTKPISIFKLIFGKFLGVITIGIIALLPSLIYVFAISQLAQPQGNIDLGSIMGSYIALLLLLTSFTAIGIFTSSLTKNQTIALILAILGCFIFYIGFENIPILQKYISWDVLGINYHYSRISEGVIDTRDVIYFLCLTALFILATIFSIQKTVFFNKTTLLIIAGIVLFGTLGVVTHYRFDLTKDKRFSLSETSQHILLPINTPIVIDVLLAGELPPEFKRLQRETLQLLESFSSVNPLVAFSVVNPLEPIELRNQNLQQLKKLGVTPAEVSTQFEGALKKEIVLPWAIMYYKDKSIKVPLLKNRLGASTEERTTESIQNLEYAFTNILKQLTAKSTKKIAILKGNEQLKDIYILDFLRSLQQKYTVRPITINTNSSTPKQELKELLKYDLLINAKPTRSFSETQKLILDQHLLQGNKQLHLIDMVNAEKDSIFNNPNFKTLTWINDLKLNDFFFAYGARINPLLIDDYYSAPIVLAEGEGENTQYLPYNWGFSTLAVGNDHIITKNIEAVKFNFSSPIELLKNKVIKTTLLTTSPLTKLRGVPAELSLNKITTPKPKEYYTTKEQVLGVLLEGPIKSAYKNRILPFDYDNFITDTQKGSLVLISDGDVIKNEASKGTPLPLGYDPISKRQYGNKEFLLNTVNYLLEDKGLVALKAKQLQIPLLNLTKVSTDKSFWQWTVLILPLLFIALLYSLFYLNRRIKFTK